MTRIRSTHFYFGQLSQLTARDRNIILETMARDIYPLTLDDIPELSRFLTTGFHTPPEADYAAPDVLRWKYLEPQGPMSDSAHESDPGKQRNAGFEGDNGESWDTGPMVPRSYIARDETGRVIGHLGLCRTVFEGQALAAQGGWVSTIHIIDWLGSPDYRSVGISLMRKAHEGVATQFGLGVSQAALVVGERAGYELRNLVPVYTRVLRAGYWLRTGGSSLVARTLRMARDAVSRWARPRAAPRLTIVLERVSAFGPEIIPIVTKAKAHAILTQRDPTRLNAILRFPRQEMTGWHLLDDTGRLRGLAVLNVIPQDQGRTRTGKIVDCLLDDIDIAPWQVAILALTRELAHQGADLAQAYASTPWTVKALSQSGYTSRFAVKFHIRDRQELIPRDVKFHLTPLEGDYAYT
jgi:hypothetical protein